MYFIFSISIAVFGIVLVYYSYGFRKGTAIVAFIFAIALTNLGFETLWPEDGTILFLVLLLPVCVVLYLTRGRVSNRKRDVTRT